MGHEDFWCCRFEWTEPLLSWRPVGLYLSTTIAATLNASNDLYLVEC